ncbi:hypothetical protein PC117_g15240 [Phytophthora cactorum]|uniref:Uncharacterized protein n=1 Tax=Phytophthora cactorum TaxID=29920 RepID=A0A8T1CNM4_9STRA|nr:hypothetical protein PC117_g15240 [Phytophthora cactorum]
MTGLIECSNCTPVDFISASLSQPPNRPYVHSSGVPTIAKDLWGVSGSTQVAAAW